ncbi:ATP-binding protein [Porcipelethomonas sp.]|uniref:ATP-binding protein n=1 Tax=Porcipelethomonas sp. TaxID=2981675 RepID=UPI003EFAA707
MFSDISFHILDILQNSLRANASEIIITIENKSGKNEMSVSVEDNGNGMTDEQLRKCCDPFFTTKNNQCTGLGISFFKYAAEITGGKFSIESVLSVGTVIKAVFLTDSINCIPVGDIFSTVYSVLISSPETRIILHLKAKNVNFTYDSVNLTSYFRNTGKINYQLISAEKQKLKRNIEKIENEFVNYNII